MGFTAGTSTLINGTQSETFTAAGNGSIVDINTQPGKSWSLQIVGTGAAATLWDVRLEGSLDNINFDTILNHVTATGDGKILWSGGSMYPSPYIRSRVASVTLGSATNISVLIFGVP